MGIKINPGSYYVKNGADGICAYGGSTPAFSPTDVPGLKLWVAASSLPKNDGDTISSWPDLSGNGNTLTATGTPIFHTNRVNGKPAVTFNSGNYFTGPDVSTLITAANNVLFVVYNAASISTNSASNGYYLNDTLMTNAGQASFGLFLRSTGPTLQNGGQDSGNDAAVITTPATGNWIIGRGRHVSGMILFALENNGTETSKIGTGAGNTNPVSGNFRLGRGFTTQSFTGQIAEALVYNTLVSAPNLAALMNYLNTKYAIY